MCQGNASLRHDLDQIPGAQLETQVPPHAEDNDFSIGTTSGVLNKLKAGEKGDVIVISDEAAEVLEKDGKLVPGTLKPVASSLFGVVVKAGAATPDISTAERLKQAVTAARNISYPD